MSEQTRLHDNAVRWQAEDRGGHVESFFLKANDPGSDRAFWLKFTIYAPIGGTGSVGEVWAILFDRDRGHVAAKETYPIAETVCRSGEVGVVMKDSQLEPGRTVGRLHLEDGTPVSWDLRFNADRSPLYLFPYQWMYRAKFPKFKSITPTADSLFDGFIEAGDRRFEVSHWVGMQGHNWGRAHAERYAWAHCNLFEDGEEAIFEGFTARIKLGPLTTPFITLATLTYRGVPYEFTAPSCWLRAATNVEYTSWDFVARHGRYRLLGSLWTTTDDMVGLTYRNPNGETTHCLNSKIAHCELRLAEDGETRIRLRADSKAALEVAVRESTHGVKMVL